ncbi:MAG: hypothetical protein OIF50_00950 [Flavobacteriaceae bacterium]|nr:hypothetical protein [Flavobacteriaceae bacterium]
MRVRVVGILFLGLIGIMACSKNNNTGAVFVPAEPYAEQAAKDHDSIEKFLKTHFYNYDQFENPPANFDFKIKVEKIEGANADKTPLFDQMSYREVLLSDEHDDDVKHKVYYLIAREGLGGQKPTVADSTFLNYRGMLLDKTQFDKSVNPIWFDLLAVTKGFREGVAELKPGGDYVDNGDGTGQYKDYGVGMIVMPSALGYFNSPPTGSKVKVYSPLIFFVDLFRVNEADHDKDGIPSIEEDLNGDGNLFNDDTDENRIANYNDNDDDGDGILTKDEIIINDDGTYTFKDSDNDGTPDHLDIDS